MIIENQSLTEKPASDDHTRVAIIGGGIAGLICLHELRKRGVQATVFEMEGEVGGRIRTHRFPSGETVDLGAGYFHKYYSLIWRILDETGLRDQATPRKVSGTAMILQGERVSLDFTGVLKGLLRGLLSPSDVGSLLWLRYHSHKAAREARRQFKGAGKMGLGSGVEESWLTNARREHFGDVIRRLSRTTAGFVNAVSQKQLFQPASDLNRATALLLLSSASTPLYTLKGGLNQMTQRLATLHGNRVVTNCQISSVERTSSPRGYQLLDSAGRNRGTYEHVVIATPHPTAQRLAGLDSATPYATARVLVVKGRLRPEFAGSGKLYIVGSEAGVHGITDYGGGIFKVGVGEKFDLVPYFLEHRIEIFKEWQHGLPCVAHNGPVPVGNQGQGLWLVGDYALPCMESAAFSAVEVASAICDQLGQANEKESGSNSVTRATQE
jgi:predicted NAD/FAD-dependent oxidoreductase